jgi:type IV pilus assembly protein PilV
MIARIPSHFNKVDFMHMSNRQTGATLLEVLVAIVIFSLGILGILGLQASTAGVGADARFRTEASALADELIAKMQIWNSDSVQNDFVGDSTTANVTGGAQFLSWYNGRLLGTSTRLPSAEAKVTVELQTGAPTKSGYVARINIKWLVPSSKETAAANQSNYSQYETVVGLPR